MKKLYLVDVSSMYFRAFYAVRPLTNSKGLPTNALYGFLSMAVKLLKEVHPDYMAFCFDVKEPNYRYEIYKDYKANRSEMPEDLVPQVPYVKKITEALGIPIFEKIGFEADDLIGTLAHFGRDHKLEVVIVSGDKDLTQLIGPYVSMYDTMKEVKYDRQGVIEKWGVEPTQVIDYLSLVGDASDNIPGVSGIGPKGAQKLLAEFKTLDGIYENLDKIKNPGLQKKLAEGKDDAYLSKKLVTIRTDIELGIELKDLELSPIPKEKLKGLLEELEFKSFEKRVFGPSEVPAESSNGPAGAKEGSFTGAKDQQAEGSANPSMEGISGSQAGAQMGFAEAISTSDEIEIEPGEIHKHFKSKSELWGFFTDRGSFLAQGEKIVRLKGVTESFAHELDSLDFLWKGYDLKAFWHLFGLKNPRLSWDSFLAAYVVRAGEVGPFRETVQHYTGMSIAELPSGTQIYKAHINLEARLQERLSALKGLKVLEELDLPLAPILYRMERKGVLIDPERLRLQSQELDGEIGHLEKEIFKETGHSFNLTSPKQLSEVLFVKMKIPPVRKTKTGFSTDSDVLEKLATEYPFCKKIIDHREAMKLKSTYLDSLPQLIDPKTGRIHTRFNQAVTTTGRLSSTNPNLQNIPIRTERGARIRRAFVVPEGRVLLSADYSQIELRILAHISGDPNMISAFEADLDIHAATASEVFDVKLEKVTSDQRRVAKAVNFGIAYGMSPYGLSENLGIDVAEATDIIKRYFSRFPRVRDYMHDTVELAKRQGFVETLFGRRRYLDELQSKNQNIRKFGERAAINAPMQGTSADIVKRAMIVLDPLTEGTMTLQVHDELVFEVEESKADSMGSVIKKEMERVVKLKVPLKVNIAKGKDWDSAH